MATLYELTDHHQQLLEMMENEEISDQAFIDTLDLIESELKDKLEGYVHVIKSVEMQMEAAKKEIERLEQYKRTRDNKIKAMKESILATMKALGQQKINAGLFTVRYQNNPAGVKIVDEKAVPDSYLIPQAPKVDHKQLIADLKNGVLAESDNIKLTQDQHLRIS